MSRITLLLLLGLVVLPVAGLAAGEPMEQEVQPLTPRVEQRIETLTPTAEQRVEVVNADGTQQVSGNATQSATQRGVQSVAKAVVGVLAAVVSMGVMAASLLLI